MPEPMTPDQRRAFLRDGTRTAIIATTRADGRPHAVPVWFVLDGDDILISTAENTVKGKDIRRDPRVTVVADDAAPPYAFVKVDGVAEVIRDAEEIRRVGTEIGRRYLGDEGAAGFGEYASRPGGVIVRVRPEHTVAVDRIAG